METAPSLTSPPDAYLREVITRRGTPKRVAVIRTELTADQVRAALADGRIRTFETERDLTEADIDAAEHIVAQIGPEPIIAAFAAP